MNNPRPLFQCVTATAACLMGLSVYGGTIVPDLNDGDAVFSSTTPTTTGIDSYAPTLANGVTLAASVTPTALDISNSAAGAVAVIETGGTTSGTGLWILDGNLWFLASSGNATAVPSSSLDLDGSDKAIGVQLGAVTGGIQLDVFASFDGANGSLLVSQNSSVSTFSLSNVTGAWNWTGNDSVGFGIADPTLSGANLGWRGGLADLAAGTSIFSCNSAQSLDGSVTLGQVFNAVSTVPEPGTSALIGFGLAALIGVRRRIRS